VLFSRSCQRGRRKGREVPKFRVCGEEGRSCRFLLRFSFGFLAENAMYAYGSMTTCLALRERENSQGESRFFDKPILDLRVDEISPLFPLLPLHRNTFLVNRTAFIHTVARYSSTVGSHGGTSRPNLSPV
jgi:hypothetical protein